MSSYSNGFMSSLSSGLLSTYTFSGLSVPFSWMSMVGLNLSDYYFDLTLPKPLVWMLVGYSSHHLLRKLNFLRKRTMTYFYSFFNSKKYLSPVADKFPND